MTVLAERVVRADGLERGVRGSGLEARRTRGLKAPEAGVVDGSPAGESRTPSAPPSSTSRAPASVTARSPVLRAPEVAGEAGSATEPVSGAAAEGSARRAPSRVLAHWPVLAQEFPVEGASAGALAARLESVALVDADDVDLLGLVVGWQQLVGVAVAAQAEVLRELMARGHGLLGDLPQEVAAALAWTRPAAQALVARAGSLGDLPELDEALRAGTMDARKVDVVLDEVAALVAGTDVLPDRDAVERATRMVATVAAERAADLTPTQLRRLVRREVLAVDPEATRVRAAQAHERRCVRVDWAPDGMAWVSAFLSAPDAMVVSTVLDAATDTTDVIDERTRDQRRADLFVALFRDIADTGVLPCGRALPTKHRARPHIQVTVAATTLLGLDDQPAELAGHGPIPAETARRIAADGTWRRLLTDPADGTLVERGTRTYRPGAVLGGHVIARDVTCTFPGCVRPAGTGELDHITPYRAPTSVTEPRGEQTTAANLHAVCKRHHDLKTQGVWKVKRDLPGGGVAWTSQLGITYVTHPQPVLATPQTWSHGPRVAYPRDDEPPPF